MTRVGVAGSSARAAVHSLARAGFGAWAVDQFGDRDLTRLAECAACPPDRYPDALPELAARFPPGPILYTGGLENHPQVIRALAAAHELWGNPPEVLARVRDPNTLFPALAEGGFAVPKLIPPGEPCPATGRWLRKPIRSAGGLGIRFATAGEAPSSLHGFQEFIDDVPMSALFVSGSDGTALFGVTEQLVGEPWLHAQPFGYCGNIGPIQMPERAEAVLWSNALVANRAMGLRGLWGLDFVRNADSAVPVEVNPRYTAATEVLELGTDTAVLTAHAECFTTADALARLRGWNLPQVPPAPPSRFKTPRRYDSPVGKAIYFAPHALTFPARGPWDEDLAGGWGGTPHGFPPHPPPGLDPWRVPQFADIPEPGAAIDPGSPVFSFFATGPTPAAVRDRLRSRAAELDHLFKDTHP